MSSSVVISTCPFAAPSRHTGQPRSQKVKPVSRYTRGPIITALVVVLALVALMGTLSAVAPQVAAGTRADSIVTVASDTNPSIYGQSVTFTATVRATPATSYTVTNYPGNNMHYPYSIVAGPDGALWFTNLGGDSIGRISITGTVQEYFGTGINDPVQIAAASDGALWFTNFSGNSIGRITTDGAVTRYTGTGISGPFGIATGPDGALWFTNHGNSSIGRITTAGVVTNYTGIGVNDVWGIAAGPDCALWFVNHTNNSIGRISTDGVVANYTGAGISGPYGITAGPDGALWFTNFFNDSIGRIATDGTVTNYTGTGISSPYWITAGPDNALWYTNFYDNSIGRITTAGEVASYTDIGVVWPSGITRGPDGALWFLNYTNPGSVGRIASAGIPTGTIQFHLDGSDLGLPVALDVSGQATTPAIADLVTGSHTITATYDGDANFSAAVSDPVPQTVNRAGTTTTITGVDLATDSVVGQGYTVSWTVDPVAPGAGVPTGTVTVSGGSECTAPVAEGECDLVSTTAGLKSLVATYSGDVNFEASTSTAAQHRVNDVSTAAAIRAVQIEMIAATQSAIRAQDARKLGAAAEKLTDSLDPALWVDGTHLWAQDGVMVFQREKQAVQTLIELINDTNSLVSKTTLQGWVDALVQLDRDLAQVALDEAVAAGGDARNLDAATKDLAKGDAMLVDGKFADAIEHYKNAWTDAQQAVD